MKARFLIFQNIDDWLTLGSKVKKPWDPTSLKVSPEEAGISYEGPKISHKTEKGNDTPDISEFSDFWGT